MKKDGKLKNADGSDGVRLIYIDPSFATRQEFKVTGEAQVAYSDKLSGSQFIEFIRKRLILAKELLSNDGVIFVHLDQKMVHYIKVIMDEIFGKNNFRNEIIWKYFGPTSTEKNFPKKHDVILFYSKSSEYYFDSSATLINYDEKAIFPSAGTGALPVHGGLRRGQSRRRQGRPSCRRRPRFGCSDPKAELCQLPAVHLPC